MKLSHNFFCLLLVVLVCLLAVFIDTTETHGEAGKRAGDGDICRYARKGEDGPCDNATNTKEVSLPLRQGDPATCAATTTVSKPCDDMSMTKKKNVEVCRYARKGEDGPCDSATNTKEVSLPLKKGDPAICAATKAVSTPCDDMSMSKKKKVEGCKYERKDAVWSECDTATGTKTKVMTLKEGSNPECPPERTKTENC